MELYDVEKRVLYLYEQNTDENVLEKYKNRFLVRHNGYQEKIVHLSILTHGLTSFIDQFKTGCALIGPFVFCAVFGNNIKKSTLSNLSLDIVFYGKTTPKQGKTALLDMLNLFSIDKMEKLDETFCLHLTCGLTVKLYQKQYKSLLHALASREPGYRVGYRRNNIYSTHLFKNMLEKQVFIFDRYSRLDICKSSGLKPEYYGPIKSIRSPVGSIKTNLEKHKQNGIHISKTGWAILLNKLDQKEDMNSSKPIIVNNSYYSILGLAIATGRTDLLNSGYDINSVSKINSVLEYPFDTALRLYVVGKVETAILRKLLDEGSNISKKSLKFIKYNNLSKHLGVDKKVVVKKDFVYYLIKGKIDKGVNILKTTNLKLYSGRTLAKACIMANSLEVTAFYLNYLRILFDELELELEDEPTSYLLLMLEQFKPWFNINCYLNCIRLVVFIRPYELNRKGKYGETPLMLSTKTNQDQIPQLLLELGANIEGKDLVGRSFVHYVCKYGNPEMLNLVVRYSAEQLNYTDNLARTPIFYAAKNGKSGIVDVVSRWNTFSKHDIYGVGWEFYTGNTNMLNIFGHTYLDEVTIRVKTLLNGGDHVDIDKVVSFFRRKYF